MQTCIDTCCLVNLLNGGYIDRIIASSGHVLHFQGLVEDELIQHRGIVDSMVAAGKLHILPGSLIFASEVADISLRYNLGLGESECIVICQKIGFKLASDDGRARRAGMKEIGTTRVTGSIGLLRATILSGAMTASEGIASWSAMIAGGGFLPPVDIGVLV